MPGGDRTGPMGYGPMTGRSAGFCAGYNRPGYTHPGYGRGMGRGFGRGFGRGMGRGMGWGYGRFMGWGPVNYLPANQPYDNESDYLKAHAEMLEQELNQIKQRMSELENKE